MYHRPPTPSRDQQWSDEVRYLHSLWHQGPPNQPNPNPNPNRNPKPTPTSPISNINKKISKKKKKKKKKQQTPPPPQVEWPCNSPIIEDTRPWEQIGWPEQQTPKPQNPVSIQDQKRLAALQLQQNSLRACQDFLHSESESDSEEEYSSEEEEEEEEDEEEEDEDDETVELEFFLRLFKEDGELRDYYENNSESGEFCCLVCGGIGQKIGKRYKDCVALVQHSVAISKTKRRTAHRAFGKAVCRVLGWDIKCLPNIVLSLDDPLGRKLVKPDHDHAENNEGADSCAVKADNVCEDQEPDKCEDDVD